MTTPWRILHFSPAAVFSRKFLSHPHLNTAAERVHYFHFGRSGYRDDGFAPARAAAEVVRALVLLLRGLGNDNRRTIAYCHTTLYALPGLLLCRLFGVGQVVYFNHGVPYIGHRGMTRRLLQLLERINVALAHRVMTVSPAMVSLLLRHPPASALDCAIRPGSSSGVPDAYYVSVQTTLSRAAAGASSAGLRYVYAGRLQARKGVFVLLQAWRQHVVAHPQDQLLLCGFTAAQLADAGADADVPGLRPMGYVRDMLTVYDQADVVVSPSFHEGFGYTLLEGAARGCCILGTRVPGPDVLFTAWMRGLLFEPGDAASLARAMGRLSSDRDWLAIARLLSWRSSRRFSADRLQYPI